MAERKDCHALISRFEKGCKQRGVSQTINRYTERWAADALLESMTVKDLHTAMDHYFKVADSSGQNLSWQFFARNADRLLRAYTEAEMDRKYREERREQLRRILNES